MTKLPFFISLILFLSVPCSQARPESDSETVKFCVDLVDQGYKCVSQRTCKLSKCLATTSIESSDVSPLDVRQQNLDCLQTEHVSNLEVLCPDPRNAIEQDDVEKNICCHETYIDDDSVSDNEIQSTNCAEFENDGYRCVDLKMCKLSKCLQTNPKNDLTDPRSGLNDECSATRHVEKLTQICTDPRSVAPEDDEKICCHETFVGTSALMNSVDHFTDWYPMDIKDLEGAVSLCDANIQCPDKELLTGFQFEENESSTKFRYKFSCQNPGFETVHNSKVNDLALWVDWITNPWESGNVPFLDRLPVDCDENGLLSSFQLEASKANRQWRYRFGCEKPVLPVLKGECRALTTEKKPAENFFINSLRQLDVKCTGDKEFLASFALKVNYEEPRGFVWYEFSCCGASSSGLIPRTEN